VVRALVVDDEPAARQRVSRLVSLIDRVELVGIAADGREAMQLVTRHKPDLILVDLEMPILGGLDLINAIHPSDRPVAIAVTAHADRALLAFDAGVTDYVLKPVDPTRLRRAVERAVEICIARRGVHEGPVGVAPIANALDAVDAIPAGQFYERLFVPTGERLTIVRVTEISWFEADGNHVRLHIGRQSASIRRAISEIAQRLDPARFQRIHRGIIVQLDDVRQLRSAPNGDLEVFLRDGTTLPVSRKYRRTFVEALNRR
jgi:two-component system LytT family response regulator